MKITIITVGKNHDITVRDAINEYQTRLTKHIGQLAWVLIPSSTVQAESEAIAKRISGTVVLLDETGTLLTTPKLAEKFEMYQNNSVKQVTFIIGGAYGVTDDIKLRSDYIWSLSPLVFPHQIVRLLLIEQLYRIYDLLSGGRYHHS